VLSLLPRIPQLRQIETHCDVGNLFAGIILMVRDIRYDILFEPVGDALPFRREITELAAVS